MVVSISIASITSIVRSRTIYGGRHSNHRRRCYNATAIKDKYRRRLQ